MHINIKYTNLITKILRNLLQYWQKAVVLCQFFASVTLTMTFKRLFKTYCHYFLTMLYCHYVNMSVQYTAIFHGCKNGNFHMKKCEIFLIFAQNIDCGYTLEPPQRGGSNEYPQSMFWSKNKKNMYTRVFPTFSI